MAGFALRRPEGDEVRQNPVDLILGAVLFRRVDRGGQSLGLLINEGTCAGCAGTVGVEVFQFPSLWIVMDLEERRVLASHADDRSRIRSQEEGAEHLADGFKLVETPCPLADLLPVISREGKGQDVLLTQPPLKILNQTKRFFLHPAHVPFVGSLVNDLFVLVDDDRVETYRSCIDSHVVAVALHRSSCSASNLCSSLFRYGFVCVDPLCSPEPSPSRPLHGEERPARRPHPRP